MKPLRLLAMIASYRLSYFTFWVAEFLEQLGYQLDPREKVI